MKPERFQNNDGYYKQNAIPDQEESLKNTMKEVAHWSLVDGEGKIIKINI